MRAENRRDIVTIPRPGRAINPNPRNNRVGAECHQGGLDTITQHLAMEYAKDASRKPVAPGTAFTARFTEYAEEVMESISPMGSAFDVSRR